MDQKPLDTQAVGLRGVGARFWGLGSGCWSACVGCSFCLWSLVAGYRNREGITTGFGMSVFSVLLTCENSCVGYDVCS